MPAGSGVALLADIPDRQSGDGRPQRVVRREDAVIPVPVSPRLRDQIRKPIQVVFRRQGHPWPLPPWAVAAKAKVWLDRRTGILPANGVSSKTPLAPGRVNLRPRPTQLAALCLGRPAGVTFCKDPAGPASPSADTPEVSGARFMNAWPSIVESHAGLVWQTIRRLIDHEEDAADCFQETFAAALAASNQQMVRHWPAFLVRIATNQALDRLRSRSREHTRVTHDHDFGQTASRIPEPAAVAEERELVDRLRHAVATLPKDQAEAFWLATFESLPHAEIGASLGITANHVGVLLHRARRALQSFVAPSIRVTEEP